MFCWFKHVTAAACYRFEEGMGMDKAIICLVPEALKDPQLRPQHVLIVKAAFRQMVEVRCKNLCVFREATGTSTICSCWWPLHLLMC